MGAFGKWLQLKELDQSASLDKEGKVMNQVGTSQFNSNDKLASFMAKQVEIIQSKNPNANKARIIKALKDALNRLEQNNTPEETPSSDANYGATPAPDKF